MNSHLLVSLSAYHLKPDEEPTGIEGRYSSTLTTQEDIQPYERHFTLKEYDYVPLDTGWVQISNKTGEHVLFLMNQATTYNKNPTEEERKLAEQKVVEVLLHKPYGPSNPGHVLLRPGESVILRPSNPKEVYLRSRSGSVKISLLLFPS